MGLGVPGMREIRALGSLNCGQRFGKLSGSLRLWILGRREQRPVSQPPSPRGGRAAAERARPVPGERELGLIVPAAPLSPGGKRGGGGPQGATSPLAATAECGSPGHPAGSSANGNPSPLAPGLLGTGLLEPAGCPALPASLTQAMAPNFMPSWRRQTGLASLFLNLGNKRIRHFFALEK